MSTPIATIQSITPSPDQTGSGVQYLCTVLFSDVTSGYSQTKTYAFATNSTVLANKAIIQADLNVIKAAIAGATNLQSAVGTVLT